MRKVKISIDNIRDINAGTNDNLLSSLNAAGIVVEADCGGQGSCGKCKIRVLSGQAVDSHGNQVKPENDGLYLACQVYPGGDLVIDKIEKPSVSQKGKIEDILISSAELVSPVNKVVVKPIYPTLDKNYSLQDMIRQAMREDIPFNIYALKELARIAPEKPEEITLALASGGVIAVETGDTTATLYGVAFDIGTTTVAGMLVNLKNGKVIAAAAETNPQVAFGADVISRIRAAGTSEGLARQSMVIGECLNTLISKLCNDGAISNGDVYLVTVAGNSTMEHLLLGISPDYLTISPYVTTFSDLNPFAPDAINLHINPGGKIILLPNIAGFVGADTVAAAVAVNQDLTSQMTLLIDLGTNGEMVLGNKDKMVVCSTAAGPAFEGAQLSCGMRAAPGAVDSITIHDDVSITTVKGERPKGICGSGVIKAIAELLEAGVITTSGRFIGNNLIDGLPSNIKKRLKVNNGQKEFVLVFAEESATGFDISLTQGDIREIQLVKSSIYTGTQILMESFGIDYNEIEQVLIAGAFGNYIDLESALAIGLVPPVNREKLKPVGNAAGTGAVKALVSKKCLERSYKISNKAGFVELANHDGFQKRFISNLAFPEVSK